MRGNKLRLVKGETVVLPCCVAVNERSLPIDLQVSCAVALVPHSPLRGGRKVPADQSCTHINVSAAFKLEVLLMSCLGCRCTCLVPP